MKMLKLILFISLLIFSETVFSQTASDYFDVACILSKELKYKDALKFYNKAIAIDNDFAKAFFNRALVKEALKDYKGALMDFRKALSIDSNLLNDFVYRMRENVNDDNHFIDINKSYLCVANKNTTLNVLPFSEDKPILTIKKKRLLFLNTPENFNNCYKVIDIKTNTEGWIKISDISILKEVERNSNNIFSADEKINSSNSEILVINQTDLALSLSLNSKVYKFKSGQKKRMVILPGNYNYIASAPNVLPSIGNQKFESGIGYSWTFYIKTSYKNGSLFPNILEDNNGFKK